MGISDNNKNGVRLNNNHCYTGKSVAIILAGGVFSYGKQVHIKKSNIHQYLSDMAVFTSLINN